jgi:hypothetical protein
VVARLAAAQASNLALKLNQPPTPLGPGFSRDDDNEAVRQGNEARLRGNVVPNAFAKNGIAVHAAMP